MALIDELRPQTQPIAPSIHKRPCPLCGAPVAYTPRPEPREIIREVAARHLVTFGEITGPKRTKEVARARQEAMWRLRTETSLSLAHIGMMLGRTHWTVMHGLKAHEKRIAG